MQATPGDRMARAVLATDLFRVVLENSDSPSGLGRMLTRQLRELIGGRVVVLVQFEEIKGVGQEQDYRLLGICPDRQSDMVSQPDFLQLIAEGRSLTSPKILRMDEPSLQQPDRVRHILLIPLRTSSESVGVLIFLDLMDLQNVVDVVSILQELSTFIAVVMVNGRTFEFQERMLQARTAELRRSIEELRQAKEESEQARMRAEAANEAKSRFLANMSHELRTPLNGVLGLTSLLMETPLLEEQKSYLTLLEKSGRTLLNIINDVLDLARLERGEAVVTKETFSLYPLLEDVCAMFSAEVREKGLTLVIEVDSALPDQLYGDMLKWQQILYNLIGNAVKFTDSGKITVVARVEESLFPSGEQLVLQVRDTGIGIRTDDIPRLFRVFSQLDDSHTKRYRGTGLGLSITRQLVEMMNGSITVESEIGQGSVFSVRVPLASLQKEEQTGS
jgi:signal transduction histidine kinase